MPTYAEIRERAKDSAKYILDESCDFQAALKENTFDSWQAYQNNLDSFDVYDAAHEEADSWDVVIYSGKALDLINNTWSSELSEAEDSMRDCEFVYEDFSQTCSALAYWIVYHALTQAFDSYIDEMREFSASMQDNAEESV